MDGVGRTAVAATCETMGELALPPEASQHIGNRQLAELAELAHTEALQQLHEVGVEPGHSAQQLHRQWGQETGSARETAGHDHSAVLCGSLPRCNGGCEPTVGNTNTEP